MKKALFSILLGVAMSAMLLTTAMAEDVFVTKSGAKYHHAESRHIKNRDVEKISVEEATERGLEPSKDYLRWVERQAQDSSEDK